MRYRIVHKNRYTYSEPAGLCHNEARLIPRTFEHQTCTMSKFALKPLPSYQSKRKDFFGNDVYYFTIDQPHENLSVTIVSEVIINRKSIDIPVPHMSWKEAAQKMKELKDPEILSAKPYVLDSPFVAAHAELRDYGKPSFIKGRPVIETISHLMTRIYKDFTYKKGLTTISTPLADVLKYRSGVCQDFAHLAIACIRSFGLAARYVSGYIETIPPKGKERLIGADASHAWFSIYVPGTGWIDFDPTNNQIPQNQHITVAWGRDYSDVPPLKGVVFGGGRHDLSVSVNVDSIG
jgi:transglutaminase-like putative cysteine protease